LWTGAATGQPHRSGRRAFRSLNARYCSKDRLPENGAGVNSHRAHWQANIPQNHHPRQKVQVTNAAKCRKELDFELDGVTFPAPPKYKWSLWTPATAKAACSHRANPSGRSGVPGRWNPESHHDQRRYSRFLINADQ